MSVSSGGRTATVRFYFDADVLGVAKVIAALRPDVTFPGDPGATIHRRNRSRCPIGDPSTPDEEWIPQIAQRGWLIITRDARIAHRPSEIGAVRAAGARLVTLGGSEAMGNWVQLEIIMTQWRRIEGLLEENGPFVYAVTRTTLRQVPLT